MSFRRIHGQAKAVKQLETLLAGGCLPPALLFHGPDGVGKTIAAIEFAGALHCESPTADGGCGSCEACIVAEKGSDSDIKRLNAKTQAQLLDEEPEKQQHIKIEAVRHLVRDLEMRSLLGRWKVAIIEDAHTMQASAASALLKALEEPPPMTLWILVSSRRDQMLPTILSRCHAAAFRPLPESLVRSLLEAHGLPAGEAARFASIAEGSPGLALRMREAALPFPDSWISDPLAPFALSDNLPRELHLARPLVEGHLKLMAWHLRMKLGISAYAQPRIRRAFRNFFELSLALKSNADPRLVVQAAALELQGAVGP